jgi:hypothetical protein
MPPRCKTCSHPRRAEIDAAIIDGVSLRNIAQQFGPSPWGIRRHKQCTHALLYAAMHAKDAALGERLYAELVKSTDRERKVCRRYLPRLRPPLPWEPGYTEPPALPSAAQFNEAVERILKAHARTVGKLWRLLKDADRVRTAP